MAKIKPRTSATAKPAIEASSVTSSPRSRMGRIEIANASSPWSVSQLRPNSMASAPGPLPARDGAFEQPHQPGEDQRHAEIHEQDDRIDGGRILRVVADLLGAERQVPQADQRRKRGVLEVLYRKVA